MKEVKQNAGVTQRDKFIATARALGCDESNEAYNSVLKKVAEQKPRKPKKRKK